MTTYSCANSYHSPHYFNHQSQLHDLLLNTEVYVSDKMSTQLTIKETAGDVVVESDRALVKLETPEAALQIYVPSDENGLYSCFHTELPGELVRWLGIPDRAASKVVFRIINDQTKDSAIIMKDEDLAECHWLSNPPPLRRRAEIPSARHTTTDIPEPTLPDARLAYSDDEEATSSLHGTEDEFESPPPSPAHHYLPAWQEEARRQQYKKLLKEVVRQARRASSNRRTDGNFSLTEMEEALNNLDGQPDYRAMHQSLVGADDGTHKSRIGAAGELYVSLRAT